MTTIIQKQYETAKELLKAVERNCKYYEIFGRTQKDFDYFYNSVTSLLTILGDVYVCGQVGQAERESGVSIMDNCKQKFAAYEAELMQAGLIPSKWEQILADVEPTEPAVQIKYTEEQEAQMWHEHMKQMDYDPQF
jgi:hypothetical protein